MMKQFLTIFKKELKMFFMNRRLLISSLLPSVIILVFYILAGNISADVVDYSNETFNIAMIHEVSSHKDAFKNRNLNVSYVNYDDVDLAKKALTNGEIELLLVYDEDFQNMVENNQKPNVDIYYDSSNDKSNYIYSVINGFLFSDSTTVVYSYTINESVHPDLSNGKGEAIRIMSMLIPYLLISVLFAGCVNATSTVIAGEKERGTMATLLVTPVKRSVICFGKMLALTVIALFTSAISLFMSFIATKFAKDTSLSFNLSLYSISTIFELLIIIFFTVIFFTVVLCCVSTCSKTVKEANSLSTSLNLLILLLAMTSITGFNPTNDLFFMIPFYNTVLTLQKMFKMALTLQEFFITLGTTILYSLIGIFACKKMFDSEKIMFSKK